MENRDIVAWVLSIVLGSILILGMIGNILCLIIWHSGERSSKTACATYFKIIAALDLFNLLTNGPYKLLLHYSIYIDDYSNFLCKLYVFNEPFGFLVPAWMLIVLSFERMLSICFPLKFKLKGARKRAYITFVVLTLLVGAVVSRDLYIREIKKVVKETKVTVMLNKNRISVSDQKVQNEKGTQLTTENVFNMFQENKNAGKVTSLSEKYLFYEQNSETDILKEKQTHLFQVDVTKETTTVEFKENVSYIFKENTTDVLKENTTGVFKENTTGVFKENTTGVFKENTTGVFKENTTFVFKENATDVFKENTTGVFKENITDPVKDNELNRNTTGNVTAEFEDNATDGILVNVTAEFKANATDGILVNATDVFKASATNGILENVTAAFKENVTNLSKANITKVVIENNTNVFQADLDHVFSRNVTYQYCDYDNEPYRYIRKIGIAYFFCILPFILLNICNISILLKMCWRKATKQTGQHHDIVSVFTKFCIAVGLLHCISTIPTAVINADVLELDLNLDSTKLLLLSELASLCAFLNCSLDFVIYTCIGGSFRNDLNDLRCKFCL